LYGLRVIVAAALLIWYWPAYRELFTGSDDREAPASGRREPPGNVVDRETHESDMPPSKNRLTGTLTRPARPALLWSWPGVMLGALAFGLWLALTPGTDGTTGLPEELRTVSVGLAGLWLGLRTLGYLVTAPIAEELAFRGFLMRRFVSADFERVPLDRFHWLGFAGSSLLFGLMHGQAWLAALVAGMLFAWAAIRRGNLAEAIVAHATTNGLNLVYVLVTGDWGRLG
ncbi:MAG: CAAX prenyl protease-related protein, partial [Pirellulales bacterium]